VTVVVSNESKLQTDNKRATYERNEDKTVGTGCACLVVTNGVRKSGMGADWLLNAEVFKIKKTKVKEEGMLRICKNR
jgi:hypothetical protein